MHGCGKSDSPIVPKKTVNKGADALARAERSEGRGLAKGNTREQNRHRTQSRVRLQSELARIRQIAATEKEAKFTALWHHVYDIDRLREAYYGLKRDGARGVDGETWEHYGENLEANLRDLSERLARGAYHAKPLRRVYIPKPDGRKRPIGVPALEDKVVQRATAEVLQAIHEADFKGFSYGFRPGKRPHDALDALSVGIRMGKVSWVLDADIRSFFDTIDHEWLLKFLQHRISDKRVLRHIKKWLAAGVLEDGKIWQAEYGTPQGGSISPLLANIYLHYALDIWADIWRKREARGDVLIVRFADDSVFGFQHRSDAERFLVDMRKRFARFHLELNAEKTRLIEFGRFASENRARRGFGKPETFDFLGFTHICDKSRNGKFIVGRQTKRKSMQAKLKALKIELRRRLHAPVNEYVSLAVFRTQVIRLWKRSLRRRSQTGRCTWPRMRRLSNRWIPPPRILHPYPEQRLGVFT